MYWVNTFNCLGDSIGSTLLLNGNVHALLLIGGIMLGQDSQQGTQAQPPLFLGDALTKEGVNKCINMYSIILYKFTLTQSLSRQ